MRILLLGAYANGNIGDKYQAFAICHELREISETIEVCCVSPSRRNNKYPSNCPQLPPEIGLKAEEINKFDAIIIGGGGLLAVEHFPLNDSLWVDSINTKIIALGLGLDESGAIASRRFIERADFFSARDEYSIDIANNFRSQTELVLDPILLSDAFNLPKINQANGSGFLIPSRLSDKSIDYYDWMLENVITSKDKIASINPQTDFASGFLSMFDRRAKFYYELDPFLEMLAKCQYGFSERYHGAIFALKMGIPCFGLAFQNSLVSSKLKELYRFFDLDEFVFDKVNFPTMGDFHDKLCVFSEKLNIESKIKTQKARLRSFLEKALF